MNIKLLLLFSAASFCGGLIAMYLTRGLRAKNKTLIPDLRFPEHIEKNLTYAFVMLATFTLLEDANAIFELGWKLSLFTHYETKYGMIIGVFAILAAKNHFEPERSATDVANEN